MTKTIRQCSAIVRLNSIGNAALNILRYDQDIDDNNQKIKTYQADYDKLSVRDKKLRKEHDTLFVPNEHSKVQSDNKIFEDNVFRPVGFFRKIPKGKINILLIS